VEDDEDDYVITRQLLSRTSAKLHKLEWVTTYEEALQRMKRNMHDVYLVDYLLGERNGLELLNEARCHDCRAPIILLTGQAAHELDLEAMHAGAADYLVKGQINSQLLERTIRYAVQHKRIEEDLRESQERYALAVRGANDGVWDWNLKTAEIYYSPRWKEMLGYKDAEIGSSPEEWFSRVHADDVERLRITIQSHLSGQTPHLEHECRMLHQDGTYRWMLCRGMAVHKGGNRACRMAGSLTDITQRKVTEDQLLHNAFYDVLTGLPNRALFMDRLKWAVDHARRNLDYVCAVLFLDLNRFKNVNDSLGHTVGDKLLLAVAQRLRSCLRPNDTLARWGGDEFTVLLDGIKGATDAVHAAERIQVALATPFTLNAPSGTVQDFFLTLNIGIALNRQEDGQSQAEHPEDLLRNADIAMYRAKAQGPACHTVFDAAMHSDAVQRLQLEIDLRHALERNELRVFYQPVVALGSRSLSGFEALVRWQHPQHGLLCPDKFVPLAEETGLIVALDSWVLRAACRQMRDWQQQFSNHAPLTINVNLSSQCLAHPGLIQLVKQVLEESHLEPRSLKLELTESALIENARSASETLTELRELGVQIYLDDFGTGYSSLAYLHNLPLDVLKIDRSFVRHLHIGDRNSEIVKTIIGLSNILGIDVVAEGVETAEQLQHLQTLGCEYAQGYLFSRPVERATAESFISGKSNW
jgi:diguanylate cyclase (GGDEF)-like protein/PAS domain S-box-containing protein